MRSVYASLPAKRSSSDFGGDFVFWYPSLQIGDFHSRVAPVYTYRFDLAPRLMHMLGIGATHGIELFALFDHVDGPTARAMTLLGGRELFIIAGERMRLHWLLRLHKAARRHLADLLGNRPADSDHRRGRSHRIGSARRAAGGLAGVPAALLAGSGG